MNKERKRERSQHEDIDYYDIFKSSKKILRSPEQRKLEQERKENKNTPESEGIDNTKTIIMEELKEMMKEMKETRRDGKEHS